MSLAGAAVRRIRFRLWVWRLALRMRRAGGRLRLDAPHGGRFDGPPYVNATPDGGAGGTFTLRLGRDARLGRHMALDVWAGADTLFDVGDGTRFGQGCRVQLRGGSVRVGASTQVRDSVVLKSDGDLSIGEWVWVSYGAVLHCTDRIAVADRVGLAERVSILDSDHGADGSDTPWPDQPLEVTPVTIGRNALLGAGTVVLRGAEVGPNAVVAAGSVLTGGPYPGGWLIGGVPARPLKALRSAD